MPLVKPGTVHEVVLVVHVDASTGVAPPLFNT